MADQNPNPAIIAATDADSRERETLVAERRRPRNAATAALASTLAVFATIIGLILFAWLILFITKGRFLKHPFERFASKWSEREVKVPGDFQLYFDPLDVKFVAEGLSVSNPSWAKSPHLFASRYINTRIATFPLLFGTQRINWLDLTDGDVDLEWDAAGKRNTWTFAGSAPLKIPLIKQATVAGTVIHYRMPSMKLFADIKFDTVKATDSRFANTIRFNGTGSMRDHPISLWGQQSTPNELLAGGRNQFEAHASIARSRIDVSGTLPGATQIEGADLIVAARGPNVRTLFDVAGIAVPDTRAYRLTSHFTKTGDEYRFTRLSGHYGNSDLAGRLTVTMPNDRVLLDADLSSRLVDMIDIGPFIGYNPDALATKGAVAAVKQEGSAPRILPDAPLRIEAIKAFDAKVTYRITDIRQKFVPISNIMLGLDLDHSLMKLSPLNFDIAGGRLDSDISIDARQPRVVTDYDIRLSPTPLGKLFARFGVADAGTSGTVKARIKMSGTGDTVRDSLATSNGRIAIVLPRGTFWTSYAQLAEFDVGVFVQKLLQKKLKDPVEVNCGLIAFTVRDGIAAADPILIDTTKNVMAAKGGFSFRDESMDLAFRADGKKFSMFSGQSPIGIGGHFAAPRINVISPQLLSRAGVAVGLGLVASPLAAVIAFVDPGDAKAAACGPVLAGATASQQRTVKGAPRKDVGTRAENRDKAQ